MSTYLCLPTFVYLPMSTFLYLPTYIYLPISTYLYLPTYIYLPISTYLYLLTYLCLPTYIYLPTYVYLPSYIYLPTYVYLPLPVPLNLYIIAADPGAGIGLVACSTAFESLPVKQGHHLYSYTSPYGRCSLEDVKRLFTPRRAMYSVSDRLSALPIVVS